ncbi:No extended memory [Strongyloides ratti]|uniref:glutaminase n=1 Tax=Strongyloides ratti TaxID=34506 RepID=A0A090KXK5_STRRB|nr:No extended memory [Strongyloides ratti]CEF59993.1 No extended memory [Strongyloides ratti]
MKDNFEYQEDSLSILSESPTDTIISQILQRSFSMTSITSVTEENRHSEQTLKAIGDILNRKHSVAQIMNETMEGLNHSYEFKKSSQEDLIFELFRIPSTEEASMGRLISVLKSFGIRDDDPRMKQTIEKMMMFEHESSDDCDSRHNRLNRQQFKICIQPSIALVSQALRNQLVIPNWSEFIKRIKDIFDSLKNENSGKVATYIPQLARQSPNRWGMSICTIDGQRYSLGDSNAAFCFQSVSKTFNYAIAASDVGADVVHSYVGHEPSGRLFNEICLDNQGKPHNPMINAGAIIVTSLLKRELSMADRYDFVLDQYRKLAGGGYIGFNNATFLSERATADRNYSLSYYMKENGCFPKEMTNLTETLDLYFQLCSLETNCDSAAVMAATLANGGVCPLTYKKCVESRPCRDVLSLMYSCGMYDYSGQFSFHVGLPAKSGVSGAMIVVIPNLMGICLWSPPLDKLGNTVRGVKFCQRLIETFNFHNYDSLLHTDEKKIDPRRRVGNKDTDLVVSLLYAAKNGEIQTVRRLYLQGANLNMSDYDGRTALHLAACEGHPNLVKFLLTVGKVNHAPQDRWGRTPYDEAKAFGKEECAKIIYSHNLKKRKIIVREATIDSTIQEESNDNNTIAIALNDCPRNTDSDSCATSDQEEDHTGLSMLNDASEESSDNDQLRHSMVVRHYSFN